MSSDAWPSPDSPPAPLPRIEDLPIADQGYDQEAVRIAFDSFYRHAAQLDASLRALEAVEVFRRDADALRNDLRALRSLGVGGGVSDPTWLPADYGRPRAEVPGVVFRLAAEAALIVVVAVLAGVGNFRPVVIVALMAAAFAVVALAEWLASRARFVPPAVAFLPPLESDAEPAPYVEEHVPWAAPAAALEPVEDTEADALTVVEAPVVANGDEPHAAEEAVVDDVEDADEPVEDVEDVDDVEDESAPDPWEQGAPLVDDEPELSEPEPELVERGGIFRRRRR
jgi:hypothetical protein